MSRTKERTRDQLGHALIEATKFKNTSLIKQLLKEGADPNYTYMTHMSHTPLQYALSDSSIVKMLLDAGANPNERISFIHGESQPIITRAMHDNTMRLLLDVGADPNASIISPSNPGMSGATVLMDTSPNNVQMLLDYGADPTARLANGQSVVDIWRNNITTTEELGMDSSEFRQALKLITKAIATRPLRAVGKSATKYKKQIYRTNPRTGQEEHPVSTILKQPPIIGQTIQRARIYEHMRSICAEPESFLKPELIAMAHVLQIDIYNDARKLKTKAELCGDLKNAKISL
jgi:hypothetical protein